MESFKQLLENEAPLLHDGGVRLYLRDGRVRVTYHKDAVSESFAERSEYYDQEHEITDTDDLGEFLSLDGRESDLVDTYAERGYYLIGERKEDYTGYIADFLKNHKEYLVDGEEREIARTLGKRKLVMVKLHLNKAPTPEKPLHENIEQYQQLVQDILAHLSSNT